MLDMHEVVGSNPIPPTQIPNVSPLYFHPFLRRESPILGLSFCLCSVGGMGTVLLHGLAHLRGNPSRNDRTYENMEGVCRVRHIEVVADATTIEGWRKQVVAGQKGSERFTFISDEGSYMPGGEGTAPTPLTYFTAGIAL